MLSALLLASVVLAPAPITVTFVHTNDLHGHVLPVTIQGKTYGGYARHATLFRQLRATEPNVVVLNAGDTFQGTLFFNVYEGLADLAAMNLLGYQAMALGNHEFDKGPGPLAEFVKRAQFPILAANLDVSREPSLAAVKPYTILRAGNERIGVIGAITPDTVAIASPGPTVRFLDVAASIQKAADELTRQGINKIVALTHVGFNEDVALARSLRNVDLIIGGHSHTPLGTPALPGWPRPNTSFGYPAIVRDAAGQAVPVVQAWEWGKVVGKIQIGFDAQGRGTIKGAKVIPVDETIAEDPTVAAMVDAFRKPIAGIASQVLGETKRPLTRSREIGGEATMAELIADAMLAATRKAGAQAAFINGGGVRASLEPGKITFGDAISVQPFNNTLVLIDVTGAELQASLDHGVGRGGMLWPSAGTRYNTRAGKAVDVFVDGKPIDLTATYRICVPNYIADGGDGHTLLRDSKGKRENTGILDVDSLAEYIKANSPLDRVAERRVRAG